MSSPQTITPEQTAIDPRTIFAPRSVAIIGASANPAGHAGRALSNLLRTGYRGRIHPVNPKYTELDGLPCYPDVGAIPEPPEAAYVLLPAPKAVEAVRAAGEADVKLAIVCSSGFSELGGSGESLEDELRTISRETGIRVLGPNCIGVVSPSGGFVGAPTFNITYEQFGGPIAILSHSGGLGVTVFNRAQAAGAGVHSLVSLGNEADLTMADVLGALARDDQVDVVGLVVEQIRDPEEFLRSARAATAAGKTLVALKTGRSAAGAAAVASHTGAMAGDARIFSTVMREAGILEAASIDELTDTLHLLSVLGRDGTGRRLAVVSPSGGETVYVADQAARRGLQLPELPPGLVDRIQEWMPLGNPANPLDLTGQIIGDADLLTKVLRALGDHDEIDVLMVCLATWGAYDADAILTKVLDAARNVSVPVVFSAWDAGGMTARVVDILRSSGLAWFPSPDRALDALALVSERPAPVPLPAARAVRALPEPDSTAPTLSEVDSLALLAEAGLPTVDLEVVATADEAVEVARRWDGEVVLKLHAPEVVHKSDLGLVEVDLPDLSAVRSAALRLLERAEQHGLRHEGVVVARREKGLEVIVGAVRDPDFGPFVLVGAGGILTEYLSDSVMVSAPARPQSVRQALEELSLWRVLQGVRGRANDVDALVDLVVTFSEIFAASPWVSEADLNPVIVRPSGVGGAVAVDAAIVRSSR